ncbi:DNA-binding transcriptional LysR family regulator [Thalassospira sp. MBR-102]|jgi:DNA-binding transcriptional LysR family regulator|uniref:LysR family transcriptional regulator n=1 Tax=Thalassospira xiamenensis M-5 = DSM 17429 TaxID=1123366 RepID=A0AB72UFY5_9PROT|nr:LysR family transcriptional regulator [Thalassospira xiamenensis]MBR9778167.1 LysR family transcriptional regulator [Rhodospirillales bacterium]AJD53091.1 LysR family transcriptional regulator [Thalassospira xiamenensis M-5 = DSM 17429]MBR9817813.1 LysR family transcriptional regulator [Rhodospirillales bacterium]RCK39248.1 LysR family transcriptional regulator [Thalassospira xiamenensis]SIT28847.1 DNA-binding transcriptional regulator, LysR family [Thalassospira xiamenensis M-5 = DSM 17429
MDLLALADFNLVARHGGFGKASRATGRPKATLSRRVAELEASLELRLFERSARLLKLTEEGRTLFERTSQLFTELDETTAAIASGGREPRGKLRISAPLLFSQTAMGKLAADFALKYPKVRLEVTTEDRPVDMIEEAYDLVIRVNPEPDESLVGRVFLRDRLVIVANPGLTPPMDGSSVPAVVRGQVRQDESWNVKTSTSQSKIAVNPVLSLSSLVMVRDAVRKGVGAGRLPVSLVCHDLADGTLVHWGDVDGPEITLWALYPSRRLLSARVSAFLDFLRDAFPKGTPDELAAYVGR